ncbi:MAG TPA: biopolymer transporter ExbD [Pseudomonadota bacterium]|nr:biopolymer transporter ExbD [Pseudomonadota bacterium]
MSTQGESTPPPPRPKKKKKIHERRHLKVKSGSIRSDINVTPLVDVVLVLLIIFMVVTPMITRGMPVEQPLTQYHDKKSDSGEQVVVSVTCDGGKMGAIHWECASSRVFVSSERATDENIGELVVKEMRKGSGNREIHVKADKRLNYSAVRAVMQKIHEAGVPSVALGSEELKQE